MSRIDEIMKANAPRPGEVFHPKDQPIQIVLKGNLPRKSNSRRVARNKKTGRMLFIKSANALDWEKGAEEELHRQLTLKGHTVPWPSTQRLRLDAIIYYASDRSL